MGNQSGQQSPVRKTTKSQKTKKKGCGCGRNKSFEDRVRQNRSK